MNMSLSSTVHVIVAGELIIEPTVIYCYKCSNDAEGK